MENTEKKTYSVEEIRKGADRISSACPKQAEMLRQYADLLEKSKKRYIVTRVDVDFCAVCEVFNTKDEAVEFVKKDFKECGRNWDHRYSMARFKDGTENAKEDSFPFQGFDGDCFEWDIHEKEIA